MAESTLALSFTQLRQQIGQEMGFTADSANWDAATAAAIDFCVASGLRQFYFPPPLRPNAPSHRWSFLRPITTLVAWATLAATAANTIRENISHVSGSTTLDSLLPTFFPTMVGFPITLADGSGSFTITSYVSSTRVVVAGDVPSPTTPRQFTMTANGNYPLPDEFAALDGELTIETPALSDIPCTLTSESVIRARRASVRSTGQPTEAAIAPLAIPAAVTPTAVGQRFQIQLAPIPNTNYTLRYRFQVLPDAINANNLHAYGGAAHAETILASCLDAAGRKFNQRQDTYAARWLERLAASISQDQTSGPQRLGFSEETVRTPRRSTRLLLNGNPI